MCSSAARLVVVALLGSIDVGVNGWIVLRKTPIQTSLWIGSDRAFDFSSSLGWEEYYRRLSADENADRDGDNATPDGSTDVEWHSSVPLPVVASYCFQASTGSTLSADGSNAADFKLTTGIDVLMIGCGTSRLPDAILELDQDRNALNTITLLDSSPTCMDLLKSRYLLHSGASKLRYVCGDALALSATTQPLSPQDELAFDVILDKGLMDALLCSEGWDGPVSTLLSEAVRVLRHPGGSLVVVSYALAPSTRAFLVDGGDRVGLTWQFECEGSNSRVSISVATRSLPSLL